MKILKVQTLQGPNYWSIQDHKLIVVRLDLQNLSDRKPNEISGFLRGLTEALPSLGDRECDLGETFLEQLQDGSLWMEEVVERVALELQTLAGMPVSYSRTKKTATRGVYYVIFEYQHPEAGRYAARAAVRLCQSIADTGRYRLDELRRDLQDLRVFEVEAALGVSTEAIVKAAEAKDIPWLQLGARFLIQLGYGAYQHRIQATQSDRTSILGIELAGDKEGTKRILQDAGVPVPRGTTINYLNELEAAIDAVGGFPVAIKPLDGNHGRGVTLDINTWRDAEAAYDAASTASKSRMVIVERYYSGRDHRVLVIDGKVVAVAERVPAHVVGDGRSTINQLIESTNRHPHRGQGHDNVMTRIELDRSSFELLRKQKYSLDTVLRDGEICYLRATANLSTGGIAIDRTDEIHADNIYLAARVAKIIGLDIAGIDIVTPDISRPLAEVGGVVVEVNAAPGFRMHTHPSQGLPRPVGEAVLNMLFPPGTPSRIPIVAITGTNGKTTTTRLTAQIFRQTKRIVGYTTTDGTYIDDRLVEAGDNTGPHSARLILQDPMAEVAILEAARGGILRSGLGFPAGDVGIVLNVAADHLGIDGIDTVEDLAYVKSVVAETVMPDGYAVLNADDPLVVAMAKRVKAQIAYFSMQPDNPIVQSHVQQGGLAAVYENGYLTLKKQDWSEQIDRAVNVPLTLGGKANFAIANALAASLAAFVQGVKIEEIRAALNSFKPSATQTPGRMNLFDLGKYQALIDYAHNGASYQAVGDFVRQHVGERIGVVGGPGDRRDEDLLNLGKLAAGIFDRIIVKEDDDTRDRPRGEAADLIGQGIEEEKPDFHYETILDETTAINTALDTATDNSLVVILPESISRAIKLVESRQLSSSRSA